MYAVVQIGSVFFKSACGMIVSVPPAPRAWALHRTRRPTLRRRARTRQYRSIVLVIMAGLLSQASDRCRVLGLFSSLRSPSQGDSFARRVWQSRLGCAQIVNATHQWGALQ